MSDQKPKTVTELINEGRIHLLSTQANASTAAINTYDTITNQLVQFAELSNTLTIEVQRLQEILRKNNIQFTLPPPEPVKLPDNVAVIPEPKVKTPPTSQS